MISDSIISMATAEPELSEGKEGAAGIGKDFYINRGVYDVETASSLSSVSGVVESESKLQFSSQSTGKTSRATLVGKGRLSTLGKKGTGRSFQVQLDTVKASPSQETITSDVNMKSPWYIAGSPRGVASIETALYSPDQDKSKKSFTSSSDGGMIEVPKTRMIASRKHLDDILRVAPPLSPPSHSSHHIELGHHISDDFEVPRQSLHENSNVTNEGFLAFVGEKISHTSCRMKLFLLVGLVVFLVCIVAITAQSLTIIGNREKDEDVDSHQVDYPYEDASNTPPDYYFPIDTNDVIFVLEEEPAGTNILTPSFSPSVSTDSVITVESPSVHSDSSKPSIGVSRQTPSMAQIVPTSILDFVTSKPSINITSQTPSNSGSPTTMPSLSQIVLTPSSDTKIVKDHSAISYAKDDYLTVEGMRGATSYLRFDTSALSGKVISVAVLRLHSILPTVDEMIGEVLGGLNNVDVDFLPFAGTWDESLVTFDDHIITPFQAVNAGSFSVEGYPYELSSSSNLRQVHEVDVTEAIRSAQNLEASTNITFMLYSDENSSGSVNFASTDYSVSFGGPKLVIALSKTDYPTTAPRTSAPTSSPTMPPSIFPTPKPSIPQTPKPSIPPTPEPKISAAPTLSPFAKTSPPTLSPFDECVAECENEVAKSFDREDHVDMCIAETQDCDRQCKNECKLEAEKAEEEALTLCKEMC
jgi:hypothetical protein